MSIGSVAVARRLTVRLSDEDEKNLEKVMFTYGQYRADSAIRLCLSVMARAESVTYKPDVRGTTPKDLC